MIVTLEVKLETDEADAGELSIAVMFGWKDPKRAMTYYNPTAADIARRIG